jgi:hypothetical protein
MATEDLSASARPVVVASHPRSGTHLTIDLLRRNFEECSIRKRPFERLDRLYLNVDELLRAHQPLAEQKANEILSRAPRPPIKTHLAGDYRRLHAPQSYPGQLGARWRRFLEERGQFVYVVRDGRAAVCSYQVFSAPWDPAARGSTSDFLRSEVAGLDRAAIWAAHVRGWMERPEVTVLRFEDLVSRSDDVVAQLADTLGLGATGAAPVLPPQLRSRATARLARLRGGRPGSTATLPRSGRPTPRWQEAFSAADRALFEAQAGDVLRALGYEHDDRWVGSPA